MQRGTKVIHTVLTLADGFKWIDVAAPSPEELKQLAKEYDLHPTSIKDCLEPKHLPKFEKIGPRKFVILRHLDERALKKPQNDTVNELTRKVALFVDDKLLITVHRKETPLMERLRERWRNATELPGSSALSIVLDLFRECILSFDSALMLADSAFESFEVRIFNNITEDLILEEMYFLKRRVAVYRRVLRQTLDLVPRLHDFPPALAPFLQDLKEETERLHGWADEASEDVSTLLNTHISLASHRTNEIVRVLTVFSVFFMPLTFIVGVYGMNFRHMPEIESRFGYPAVWAVMGAVALGLYAWFRRRGWLR
jgi:magnesium transporter